MLKIGNVALGAIPRVVLGVASNIANLRAALADGVHVLESGSKMAKIISSAIKRHSECRAEIILAGTTHLISGLAMPEASRMALMHHLNASGKALDSSAFC